MAESTGKVLNGKKATDVEKVAASGGFVKNGNVPTLGKAFEGLIPPEAQESFLAFASKKPRLVVILRKEEIGDEEKKTVEAAYSAYCEEKRRTALVKVEAASLAPVLGLSQAETEGYLELYRPEQLKQLAVLAQREGLEAKDVVGVDAALLEDGSYLVREQETVTVSGVHGALSKLIKEEVSRYATRRAVEAQDMTLDSLWKKLVTENDGDEMKAAEQYAVAAKELLTGAKKKAETEVEQVLDTDLVVELFKLFNYDQQEIMNFLQYVEHNFSLTPGNSFGEGVDKVFQAMLSEYVHENCGGLVLNERSALYNNARTRQLKSLVEAGAIEASALMEMEPVSEVYAEPETQEEADESRAEDSDESSGSESSDEEEDEDTE